MKEPIQIASWSVLFYLLFLYTEYLIIASGFEDWVSTIDLKK